MEISSPGVEGEVLLKICYPLRVVNTPGMTVPNENLTRAFQPRATVELSQRF